MVGLESLRIRRLCLESFSADCEEDMSFLEYRPSRGGMCYHVHDGAGGFVQTKVQLSGVDMPAEFTIYSDEEVNLIAWSFDDEMWRNLPEIDRFLSDKEPDTIEKGLEEPEASFQAMLMHSASTLTSLNLDWIIWSRGGLNPFHITRDLAGLRFPHLRAFQLRNAVMEQTMLPEGVCLLEDTFLEFMEYHRKLQCLAWPMDRFYGHTRPSADVQYRSQLVVAHIATVLKDLRVDAHYSGVGEPFTDALHTIAAQEACVRRRRFIAEFAPHLRRLGCLKVEGGVPRDEKRELIRALHYCPLKKLVLIGVSFPVGNTWGPHGLELKAVDEGLSLEDIYSLEGEDAAGIRESYHRGSYMVDNSEFEPEYGWPAIQVPLLQTIVLHHASTVEELKLCGYHGSPILSHNTPITDPILHSLRQFDNLKQLVISYWLLTWFESDYRDPEIIKFWMDSRSPSSTALVVVTPPRSPQANDHPVDPGHFPNMGTRYAPPQPQFNRWAVALKTSFSPSALAYRVARDIGPYLSPAAKKQPGGISVRASFCVGTRDGERHATDIFDLDVRIGQHDQVLQFTGPREEGEPSRWWQKLEGRSWF